MSKRMKRLQDTADYTLKHTLKTEGLEYRNDILFGDKCEVYQITTRTLKGLENCASAFLTDLVFTLKNMGKTVYERSGIKVIHHSEQGVYSIEWRGYAA